MANPVSKGAREPGGPVRESPAGQAAGADPSAFTAGPLQGVRVLDLARVVAGPYVSRLLCDLGAEVIKIEPPEGDEVRLIAPHHDQGMSAFFQFANVGKRAICLDLRRPEGVEIVRDLVSWCDAVVENFRPGVLDRLGLGWQTIHARNPRAILLSLNGFGSDSAWSGRRAYAPILHAITGVLDDQSRFSGQPVAQIHDARADTTASLHGAVALLAALRVAEATGIGQRIEVPMYDALLATYSEANNALLPKEDDRVMNPIFDADPHGVIATAGAAQLVWRLVASAHAIPDPTPPGADLATKKVLRHRALEEWMRAQSSREAILEKLAEAGVACAPVVPMLEALTGPLARERDLLVPVDDRRGGTRPLVRSPARFSSLRNEIRGRAPRRGEHNREVLEQLLGYDAARVEQLERDGVLGAAAPDER
jgi:crotonobetainyl-CoA:carnitine CoA-transferase CaiB-like acyl-CoA transferase